MLVFSCKYLLTTSFCEVNSSSLLIGCGGYVAQCMMSYCVVHLLIGCGGYVAQCMVSYCVVHLLIGCGSYVAQCMMS